MIRFGSHSEAGGKLHNEDFVRVQFHPGNGNVLLCFLADGQGGRSNGALAAQMACNRACELAMAAPWDDLLSIPRLTALLEQADQAVVQTEGYTTLCALILAGDDSGKHTAVGASSGDSKMYLGTGGGVEEWTAGQAKNPPVGSGEAWFAGFTQAVSKRARVLMVSDGVWKYAGFEAIAEALSLGDGGDAGDFLKRAVRSRSGEKLPDDFSVIWIELD